MSGARCTLFAYGPSDATATPSSLASLKFRLGFNLNCAGLPRLSWKKAIKWASVCILSVSPAVEKKNIGHMAVMVVGLLVLLSSYLSCLLAPCGSEKKTWPLAKSERCRLYYNIVWQRV